MHRILLSVACLIALHALTLRAQPQVGPTPACTNASLVGAYSYAIGGYLKLSNGGTTGFADAGIFQVSANGSFAGSSTSSAGGVIQPRQISGTFTLNSDCSGRVLFNDSLGNRLNLDVVVASGGRDILFIQTDSGTILSGRASRQAGSCVKPTGGYGFAIKGLASSQSGALRQFADSGVLVLDGAGNAVGSDTSSFAGQIMQRPLTATYTANADCTGSATLQDSSGNQFHLSLVIAGNSDEIFFIQTDPGTVISGASRPIVGGCAPATIIGPYSYAISGGSRFFSSSFTPFADSGLLVADGRGAFSGSSAFSNGGQIGQRTITGGYTLGSDCTGTASLTDNLGGSASLQIVAVNGGEQVLFIESDSGTTVSGYAARGTSSCNNLMLDGSFGYAINGFVPGDGASLVPFADAGRLLANGNGSFSGSSRLRKKPKASVGTSSDAAG